MEFTAKQIAELINGEVEGNADITVHDVSKIEEGRPGTLSFLANPKYTHYIYTTESSVVLVNKDFTPEQSINATLIKVDDAYQAIAQLLNFYEEAQPKKTGIEQPAYISESATLGDFAYVGAFAYIGDNVKIGDNAQVHPQVFIGDNVSIGDNVTLFPGVKIYKNCKIGNNCTIHAGSIIGSDGFGFAPNSDNEYQKIAQIGNVILEDNVEIGANTTIDRATMGSTVIKKGVKLDNLIQIAHNVVIGENTVIAALSGVAGSSKIGSNCMFGGQVGISGHTTIANGTKAGAQTGFAGNVVKENNVYRGAPAMEWNKFNQSYILFRRLPQIKKELEELQNKVKSLDTK